jgi:hypothetical protein
MASASAGFFELTRSATSIPDTNNCTGWVDDSDLQGHLILTDASLSTGRLTNIALRKEDNLWRNCAVQ